MNQLPETVTVREPGETVPNPLEGFELLYETKPRPGAYRKVLAENVWLSSDESFRMTVWSHDGSGNMYSFKSPEDAILRGLPSLIESTEKALTELRAMRERLGV